jgi:hypothetical protein
MEQHEQSAQHFLANGFERLRGDFGVQGLLLSAVSGGSEVRQGVQNAGRPVCPALALAT